MEGSGLLEAMTGGKRSHKAQYVRWLLGNIVKRNPDARIRGPDKLIKYNPPHNPPFDSSKTKEISTSERFGEVPRSRFINRMMDEIEEREPVMRDVETFDKSKLKKRVTVKKRVLKVAKSGTAKFVPGMKVPYSQLDELIIFLRKGKPSMTDREAVDVISKDYGLNTSQPTVTRRWKAYREGKIDEFGKKIKS